MYFTKRRYMFLGGAAVLIAALALAASTGLNRSDPITVPDQTAIQVRLNHTVASDRSRPGDHFTATVSQPIMIDNKVVIPQGAQVQGLVVDARQSGRLKGRAQLSLRLETVELDDTTYSIRTTSAYRVGGNHKKRNIALIGGGAGGGTLIGALAAGGKGALIGGPVGAGAGTAVALITGRKDITLPAETSLTFRLAEPVTINLNS